MNSTSKPQSRFDWTFRSRSRPTCSVKRPVLLLCRRRERFMTYFHTAHINLMPPWFISAQCASKKTWNHREMIAETRSHIFWWHSGRLSSTSSMFKLPKEWGIRKTIATQDKTKRVRCFKGEMVLVCLSVYLVFTTQPFLVGGSWRQIRKQIGWCAVWKILPFNF